MKKLLLVLAAIPLVLFAFWRVSYPAFDWQQTLTFYITTPDGPVVATNTGHARWREGPRIFVDGAAGAWSYDGEALMADLGGGKFLFSLLHNNLSLARLLGEHSGKFEKSMDHTVRSRAIARSRGDVQDVPFDLLPPLATLSDLKNLESLSFVDPKDFFSPFGPGYSLDRVTFEITKEPTTFGQFEEFRLDWFVMPQRWSYRIPVGNENGFFTITSKRFYQGENVSRYLEK